MQPETIVLPLKLFCDYLWFQTYCRHWQFFFSSLFLYCDRARLNELKHGRHIYTFTLSRLGIQLAEKIYVSNWETFFFFWKFPRDGIWLKRSPEWSSNYSNNSVEINVIKSIDATIKFVLDSCHIKSKCMVTRIESKHWAKLLVCWTLSPPR